MSVAQVQYVRLGKSGLRVSVPIIGAMSFGSSKWDKWVLDEDKSLEVLKAAWGRGINTIDTANVYSDGESEKVIAKFIEVVSTLSRLLAIPLTSHYRIKYPETRFLYSPNVAVLSKKTSVRVESSALISKTPENT
ncbi:Aldo/keto reductase [Dendrothele bispora CBS 962.96]|uniref:Aldo/keto reductase n=1 Tax=Dendrothele bispora (strain CBS 962.96) TaxID=1314807 RepID=A0A4S8KQA4_DENBC|nr:Aldo/keto reductase [Dendrothele bispora CBS 962.96]